jgi:hypothetical protein
MHFITSLIYLVEKKLDCVECCCENGQLNWLIACDANPSSIDDDNIYIIHGVGLNEIPYTMFVSFF